MNILVISDSHGDTAAVRDIINYAQSKYAAVDKLFHCGDGCRDASALFNNSATVAVAGNNDIFTGEPLFRVEHCESHIAFITHGHRYNAIRGTESLILAAKSYAADIICFGHTHRQFYRRIDGIHVVNPGAAKDGEGCIIQLNNESVVVEHFSLTE